MKALQCPFLARLPISSVSKNAPALLSIADHCPVMKHAVHYTKVASVSGKEITDVGEKCPYVSQKREASSSVSAGLLSDIKSAVTGGLQSAANRFSAPSTGVNKCPIDHSKYGTEATKNADERGEEEAFPYEEFWSERVEAKKRDHSYRVFRNVERDASSFPRAKIAEENDLTARKEIQVWCSNDYMGMSWHPQVRKAVKDAVDKHGVGAGGTRNISGTSPLHTALEKELAQLHQKESALLFTSCYVANDTSLFTMARMLPGCHIFSDAGNHASMIQGIRTSGIPKHVFKHNDPADLRRQLQMLPKSTPKIVAFETVYSMSGTICPLSELLDVCEEFGAISFIDEVHAVGLYGEHGAGIGEREGVLHRMDIISGTLGKAYGNIGGYIASSARLIDTLRSYCSGFIFTTSLPPTVLAGTLKAVQILASDEGRHLREKHQRNVATLREMLYQAGLPVMKCPSHILPIKVGDPELVFKLSRTLLEDYGIYVQPINYPTVPRGREMLRVAPTPHHTPQMMDHFVKSLVSLWEEYGLDLKQPECGSCKMTLNKKYWDVDLPIHSLCNGMNCSKYLQAAFA